MSEEILKVFLDDMQTVRIACQECQAIIETDVLTIKAKFKENRCPICGNDFSPPGKGPKRPAGVPPHGPMANVLHEVEQVFRHLDAVRSQFTIEFPVKIKSADRED